MPGKVEAITRRALLADWALAGLMTACSRPPIPTAAPVPVSITYAAHDRADPSLLRLRAVLEFPDTMARLDKGRAIINTPAGLLPNTDTRIGEFVRPHLNLPDPSLKQELRFELHFIERPTPADNRLVVAQLGGMLAKFDHKARTATQKHWQVHLPGPVEGGKNHALVLEWENWIDITKAEWNGTAAQCVNVGPIATICAIR